MRRLVGRPFKWYTNSERMEGIEATASQGDCVGDELRNKILSGTTEAELLYVQSVYVFSYVQAHVSNGHTPRCPPLMGVYSVLKVKRHFECPQIRSPYPAGFLGVERPLVGKLAPDQARRQAAAEHLASLSEL